MTGSSSEVRNDVCTCCETNDYYTREDYSPCENCGHSLEKHGSTEHRRLLAAVTGLTEQEIVEVGDVPCCDHPEVVHGGWARPDGSCGYRGCKCRGYRR